MGRKDGSQCEASSSAVILCKSASIECQRQHEFARRSTCHVVSSAARLLRFANSVVSFLRGAFGDDDRRVLLGLEALELGGRGAGCCSAA
mmetsp:Transcript_70824/g.158572  ORF Transcript_70824/g.158572 Transcript_70824/m.158572 type:complete len:90 (+) Transcript_70824:298-567(+)